MGEIKAIGLNGYIEALLIRISSGDINASFANDPQLVSPSQPLAINLEQDRHINSAGPRCSSYQPEPPVLTEEEAYEALRNIDNELAENNENIDMNVIFLFGIIAIATVNTA